MASSEQAQRRDVDGEDATPPMEPAHDTPINRATLNQMTVDQLDTMLAGIRERRLERVRKLEALAQVKADEAMLVTFMKFERAVARAKRAIDKLKEAEDKADAALRVARLLAVECNA